MMLSSKGMLFILTMLTVWQIVPVTSTWNYPIELYIAGMIGGATGAAAIKAGLDECPNECIRECEKNICDAGYVCLRTLSGDVCVRNEVGNNPCRNIDCGGNGQCVRASDLEKGYFCACFSGYDYNGTTCVRRNAITECETDSNSCGAGNTCLASPGSDNICFCPSGQTSGGATCGVSAG